MFGLRRLLMPHDAKEINEQQEEKLGKTRPGSIAPLS